MSTPEGWSSFQFLRVLEFAKSGGFLFFTVQQRGAVRPTAHETPRVRVAVGTALSSPSSRQPYKISDNPVLLRLSTKADEVWYGVKESSSRVERCKFTFSCSNPFV